MKYFTLLGLLSLNCVAAQMPPFEAKYQVKRGGKVVAEQTTKLSRQGESFILYDQTIATKGMASWIGFKRQERSDFHYINDNASVQATSHLMKQVTHKDKTLTVASDQPLISTHMMPLQIGLLACQGLQQIQVHVLKNKRVKTYRFSVTTQRDGLLKVSRAYPKGSQRKTTSWLDPTRQCLTTKTQHKNESEPLIETTLQSIQNL